VPVVNVLPLMDVAVATPRLGVVRVGLVAKTTFAPEPVTPEIRLPLTLKLLPEPAVSNVLPVSVAVPVSVTRLRAVPAWSGIVRVAAPTVWAASESVTVCAVASAVMSLNAPEVLPLIWTKPVLVLPDAVVSDGVVASLMVVAPDSVFAPVLVIKVPVEAAQVFAPEPEAVLPPAKTGVFIVHEVVVLAPVNVLAASVRAIVAEVVGNVMVVASVPAKVREFENTAVLLVVPPAIWKPVALAVSVRPFTVVAATVLAIVAPIGVELIPVEVKVPTVTPLTENR